MVQVYNTGLFVSEDITFWVASGLMGLLLPFFSTADMLTPFLLSILLFVWSIVPDSNLFFNNFEKVYAPVLLYISFTICAY